MMWDQRQNRFLSTSLLSLALLAVLLQAAAFPAFAANPVSFPTPVTFTVDAFGNFFSPVMAIATGDFNGDGKLDMVAASGSHNDISILLGNGDGTFKTPAPVVQAASGFNSIVAADFNGDHLLDLAAWGNLAGASAYSLCIYAGNGAGSFTQTNCYTVANSSAGVETSNALAVADLNGDGKMDLVGSSHYSGAYAFLGNGDGSFKTAVNYPDGSNGAAPALGIALGDLNGDGKPDMAVSVVNGMSVLLNTGNGTFGASTYYDATTGGAADTGIAISDLNRDGKLDVVVGNSSGSAVFLNSGNGTFTVGQKGFTNSYSGQVLSLGDVNGDGKVDLVIGNGFGYIFTYVGKGDGTFTSGPSYPTTMRNSVVNSVSLADFNGDKALDIISSTNDGGDVRLMLGRGDGSFQMNAQYGWNVLGTGHNLVTADFNTDGIPDLAYSFAGSDNFALTAGSSHGVLGNPVYTAAGTCTSNYVNWIAAGDVNGDGKIDIVATLGGSTSSGCQQNKVAVLAGTGSGHFQSPVFYSTGAAATAQEAEVFLADLNGDGKLDIVLESSDGTLSVLLNKGRGTFGVAKLISSLVVLSPHDNDLAIADFNGDGKIDIALTTYERQAAVYVLLGDGTGNFGAPITTTVPYSPSTVVAGDFNHDGKVDLAVEMDSCSTSTGNLGYAILSGNGNGSFTAGPNNCLGGTFSGRPVTADLNGDGKLDLFFTSTLPTYGSCQFNGCGDLQAGPGLLQGNGDGTFTIVPGPFYIGTTPAGESVADFNGDGMPDIAVLNNDNLGQQNNSFSNFITVMQNASQPVSVSPLVVNYGTATVGTPKNSTVVLTNNQRRSLSITSISVGGTDAGDFTVSSNCGTSRKAGWDCTITVKFSPTTVGTRSGTLSIVDSIGTQTVQLNGTGQ